MREKLIKKFTFTGAIKRFFEKKGFIEVITPPMVQSPGIEPHLHPFKVQGNNIGEMYLHTSPEFHMKELLSHGLEKIFTISYSFRDEPQSTTHRPQFLMLEWYEANVDYNKVIEDSINLINELSKQFSPNQLMRDSEFICLTVKEAFLKFSKTDLDEVDSSLKFKNHIKNNFPQIPLPKELLDWDDYFFLLFLNEIEPRFKDIPKLILKDYPASQAALSTLKEEDPTVCE
ncbi:MAG: hypothetical protein CME61_05235, partial [Halobacteriovoraceae bacterium]|nr:hypothetical protein [Halobacteriovoraceae bacterium]